MAAAYGNLVKYLELATRQLKKKSRRRRLFYPETQRKIIINDLVLSICKETH